MDGGDDRSANAGTPNPFVNRRGVPSHVRTQQGRVNAQQGRCPLNLKGFLNAEREQIALD